VCSVVSPRATPSRVGYAGSVVWRLGF
jgi:hypothetical protein